jgi:hypothetical protein
MIEPVLIVSMILLSAAIHVRRHPIARQPAGFSLSQPSKDQKRNDIAC